MAARSGNGTYVPAQGDVVALTFDPQAGHEQAGRRPALVLSPVIYNRRSGLAIFAPITNRIKGYPFEVLVPSGLTISGAILADQIKSLDWRARKAILITTLPADILHKVLQKAALLLSAGG